ncbi:hypothetical protein EVAR_82355_1 [Eumeta japonica]|uniref:Uncharacterized protein n=1 Tax=Eumeta variegata TaxID=151549 RepID=A0A4C1U9Y9_EUMVA|nr:hypothetical protein EVAR_82355_1 [Eumeta japonica]
MDEFIPYSKTEPQAKTSLPIYLFVETIETNEPENNIPLLEVPRQVGQARDKRGALHRKTAKLWQNRAHKTAYERATVAFVGAGATFL